MLDTKTKALKIIAESGACPNGGCAEQKRVVVFCSKCIAREALRGSYRTSSKVLEMKCERA